MRFAFSLLCWLLIPAATFADPGQVYKLDETEKLRRAPVKINFQSRAGNTVPRTIDGLSVEAIASGLGAISAITIDEDGAVFLADQNKGRVIRLNDRRQDGKIDARRTLASGLINPSGLAVHDGIVFVADNRAIWQIDAKSGSMSEFVSLRQTNAQNGKKPLLVDYEKNRLLIGLNESTGTAKIIAVDMTTRHASLVTNGKERLTALAMPKKGPLWAGLGGALVPVVSGQPLKSNAGQSLGDGAEISAIIVPGQFEQFTGYPETLSGHILVAQGSDFRALGKPSDGLNVIAIPTVFGQPKAEYKVLVDGWTSASGRTAWGRPSAMAMDARGLMIADSQSGTLWRVQSSPIPPVAVPLIIVPPENKTPIVEKSEKDNGYLGSRIESGSTIEGATTLDLGSTIIRNYEAAEKSEGSEQSEE